jgi:hypothetical protein
MIARPFSWLVYVSTRGIRYLSIVTTVAIARTTCRSGDNSLLNITLGTPNYGHDAISSRYRDGLQTAVRSFRKLRSLYPNESRHLVYTMQRNDETSSSLRRGIVLTNPLGRMGSIDEVALDDISFVTGIELLVGEGLMWSWTKNNNTNNSWKALGQR